jgi:hypothetical protein
MQRTPNPGPSSKPVRISVISSLLLLSRITGKKSPVNMEKKPVSS